MRKYPADNWERLGRWVYEARLQAGYSDTKAWAAEVGRSSRMLLGLERGEPVGTGTLQAVADALSVAGWSVFARLADPDAIANIGEVDAEVVAKLKADYTAETGQQVEDWTPLFKGLNELSDEELLAEVSRRMRGGRQEFPLDIGPSGGPNVPTLVPDVSDTPLGGDVQSGASLSEAVDTPDLEVAAHEEEGSISGEQEGQQSP